MACAATINRLTALLLPVALAVIIGYSYCKRFTWAAHLVLGLSLSIAPVGAYIALTGRFDWEPCVLALLVLTWCGGFDIIYALQDADYDRAHGLHCHSPAGSRCARRSRSDVALHAVSVGALLWFGRYCPQGALLWTGEALFVAELLRGGTSAGDPLAPAQHRHRLRHAQRVGESHAGALRDRPIDCQVELI